MSLLLTLIIICTLSLLLTLGAHAQRGLQYILVVVLSFCLCLSVCLSVCVCLSVTTFSAATSNKTANKQCCWVQCHTGFILKIAVFVKMLRSKGVKQSEEANIQISTGLPRLALRTLEAPEVAMQGER